MGEKLLRWAIFTVVISLVPFGLTAFNLYNSDKLFGLSSLWPHGELLLIATALAADAIGDLVPGNTNFTKSRIATVGLCVVVLLLTALWFASIQDHPEFSADKVSRGSEAIFVFTLIVCFGSKFIE
jgi:hypothetical protein